MCSRQTGVCRQSRTKRYALPVDFWRHLPMMAQPSETGRSSGESHRSRGQARGGDRWRAGHRPGDRRAAVGLWRGGLAMGARPGGARYRPHRACRARPGARRARRRHGSRRRGGGSRHHQRQPWRHRHPDQQRRDRRPESHALGLPGRRLARRHRDRSECRVLLLSRWCRS